MYKVSEKYKEAMKRPVQRHAMKGTIGTHPFTDKNILEGSFSITNQCCGNDNVEIGQVYIGELNATFLSIPLERYQWKGQEIVPYFGLYLSDGTYEYVPLGVYTVDTAEWTASGVVVKAYDHMALLDKNCNKVITEVTPYECAMRIEKETGVVFGNTREEFESFANGTLMISETTTNDVETWRDLVSWLAQTMACFATADRDGKIVFRSYTDEVMDTIDAEHRFSGASFSDFVTRYTGLSVVNMADGMTNYYGVEPDDALTMNLGSNPFLQYGVEDTKEQMRRSILDAIQKINYVPFKADCIGNPAYDLGDVLVFCDGLADGSQKYCITKYTFQYHGKYQMTGVGQDPALSNARSKTDKNIIGLISNTDENTLVHYQFSNTRVIDIADGKRETIASVKFATATKDSEVSFWAELLLETSRLSQTIGETVSPMTATISYMLNGTMIDYHPMETYMVEGKHLLPLHYYIGSVKANTIYDLAIMLEMQGGDGSFDTNCVNVLLTGMGLAGTGQWDGTITAEEEFAGINFDGILGTIEEEVQVDSRVPTPVGFTDRFSFSFASILGGMTDSVEFGKVIVYYILSDTEGEPEMNTDYVVTNSEDAFVLRTEYDLQGKSTKVDEGYLEVVDLYGDYGELLALESMVVK